MSDHIPTVFVVEDEQAVREAIDSLLRSAGLRVRLYSSAHELLAQITQHDAGCLVLDVRLPGISGMDLRQELLRKHIYLPTLFMTGHGDVRMSVEAIKAGAMEFLTKPVNDTDLLHAIRQAMEKDLVERKDREELENLRRLFEDLTPREREIMRFVVSGLLNKQIAAEVGLSEITVKIHRGHVMRKMGAQSLADLTRIAERLMAATPDPQQPEAIRIRA